MEWLKVMKKFILHADKKLHEDANANDNIHLTCMETSAEEGKKDARLCRNN